MATILIVDDRPTNRQFLLTLLGYSDHRLLEAANGADALERVRAERPDLVITDILMPTMDGYEFVRHLRADPDLAPMPVIFYTATYDIIDSKYAAIGMLDEQEQALRFVFAKGVEPQVYRDADGARAGILGTLLAGHRPLRSRTSDAGADGLPPGHPPVRNFLGVP